MPLGRRNRLACGPATGWTDGCADVAPSGEIRRGPGEFEIVRGPVFRMAIGAGNLVRPGMERADARFDVSVVARDPRRGV